MKLSKEDVGQRYATAFYDYAVEHNVLDQVVQELEILQEALDDNPIFVPTMTNPILSQAEKFKVLTSIKKNFSTTVQNYLQIIFDYQRFDDLDAVLDAFKFKYEKENNLSHGQVTTAVEMTPEQLDNLGKIYAKQHGLKKVNLTNHVDESIIGGVILTIDNKVIDGSIKTKLSSLRTGLVNKL